MSRQSRRRLVLQGASKPILVGVHSRAVDGSSGDCGDASIYTLLTDEVMAWITSASAELAKADAK